MTPVFVDITLPESLTLPPNAVCYTTDIAIVHLFPSMGSGPSLRNTFYWVERKGNASSSSDYLNRAILDNAKAYSAISLAAEIQLKVNAAPSVSRCTMGRPQAWTGGGGARH